MPVVSQAAAAVRAWVYDLGPGRHYRPACARIAAGIGLQRGALLDVGCGPGWLCIEAAGGHPELDCVGIDVDPAMVAIARRNAADRLNCSFRVRDAREIHFPRATFDAIVSVQSMHHWERPDEILAELHRVAKPGAALLLYTADPDCEMPRGWIDRVGPWPTERWLRAMWRRHSLDAAALERMRDGVEAAGWREARVDRHGFFRRIVARHG